MLSSIISVAALALAASAETIRVDVGLNGLTFSPSNITAKVGDVVAFHYFPKNHSVASGAFDTPCLPGKLAAPLFSGFQPSASGESASIFNVAINNTTPIWLYCTQGTHCKSGMVASINVNGTSNKTLAAYAAAAKEATSVWNGKGIAGGLLVANAAVGQNATAVQNGAYPSPTSSKGSLSAITTIAIQTGSYTATIGGVATVVPYTSTVPTVIQTVVTETTPVSAATTVNATPTAASGTTTSSSASATNAAIGRDAGLVKVFGAAAMIGGLAVFA